MRVFSTVLFTVLFIAFMVCVTMIAVDEAKSHDGSPIHQRSQGFSFDYNAEHGVYCAWRHGYEGISCVKLGD